MTSVAKATFAGAIATAYGGVRSSGQNTRHRIDTIQAVTASDLISLLYKSQKKTRLEALFFKVSRDPYPLPVAACNRA
jgi:hypothetical protein